MIQGFTASLRLTRLRACALALLAVLAPTACNNADPLATTESSDPPAAAATPDSATATDSLAPAFATNNYVGVPYGPFGLWSSYSTVYWGPAPFTSSQGAVSPSGIVTFLNSARLKKQRLVFAMTGGPSTNYTTNGQFDLGKWKARMKTFNTSTIRNAVATAVADGTLIGNALIDEPETTRWGSNITKSLLDQMAAYAKTIFPTLPMGVNHGSTGYTWRRTEHYHVVDYVLNQYGWNITKGDVAGWLSAVRTQFQTDGVKLGFSLNLLGGGVKIAGCFSGSACCPLSTTGGVGPFVGPGGQNCKMTATQVRNYGRTLGVAGCTLLMWKYDSQFMSRSDNQQAFRDVASTLALKARPTCRRA